MDCEVLRGDVIAADADALVVPIDGTFVPREGQYERLLGNVGRQFIRRYASVDLVDEIEAQVDLPLALGKATAVELDEGPFKVLVLVSTLHHVENLDHAAKRSVVRRSMNSALEVARELNVNVLATPVLQGGWRLQPHEAFTEMLKAISDSKITGTLRVYCLEEDLFQRLELIARGLGFKQ